MKSDSSQSQKTPNQESGLSEKSTFRDYLQATEKKANKPLPVWRLVAPLLVQVGLIMAVPTQAAYTDVTGKTVILQTIPIDSRDTVQNDSSIFDYNISRVETLRRLRGWGDWVRRHSLRNRLITPGSTLYLILQERQSFGRRIPRAWKPIRVSSNHPDFLLNNQVALKGEYQDGLINYGLDNYSLSTQQKRRINNDISRAQRNRNGARVPILVKVKVDPQGNALPESFWIGNRNYRF
jgi:uncharacterized membrane-anchored protein